LPSEKVKLQGKVQDITPVLIYQQLVRLKVCTKSKKKPSPGFRITQNMDSIIILQQYILSNEVIPKSQLESHYTWILSVMILL
jgi:hypothetical protein